MSVVKLTKVNFIPMSTNTQQSIGTNTSKTLEGEVISDSMDKTIVVKVDRFIKHPKYDKYYRKSKKFKAHDPNNEYKKGDAVTIKETMPIAKEVQFKVISNKETDE